MIWFVIGRIVIFAAIGVVLAQLGVNFGGTLLVLLLSAIACVISYLEGVESAKRN
jgi:uncharacterized membrane protein required for colicin V production